MAAPQIVLFSNDYFGSRFQRAARAECRNSGARLTLVLNDPVRGMSPSRRRRTRLTRPLRQALERWRRHTRVWLVEDANSAAVHRRLPDQAHAVITGYMQILARPTIDCFLSCVNVHPSLLPFYRGALPVTWCLEHGEERSGYTLHRVTEEVDAGPVLRQGVVQIAGVADPLQAIVDAALPAFTDWLRHVILGTEFELSAVQASSVYRVLEGYRRRGG